MKFHPLYSLVLFAALFASFVHAQATKADYVTPQAFNDLYYDFTGSSDPGYPKGKVNISQMLYAAETSKNAALNDQDGLLIMFWDSSLYVYDNTGKQLLNILMRTSPDSGFTEMTAISHIGPALSYLAKEKEYGGTQWKTGLQMLLKDVNAVRAVNAATQNNWLDNVNAPAWKPLRTPIHNMVDYACWMSADYIGKLLSGKKQLTTTGIQKDFFDQNSQYSVSYTSVMVATFMLTAFESMSTLHDQVSKLTIDWKKAKVLIRFVAGSNVTSGVSAQSNWLVPFVKALSTNQLPDDRIYIAPYLEMKPTLGQAQMATADFQYYNYRFLSTYARTHVAKDVFSDIPDITPLRHNSIPGDYGFTKATDLNAFIARLKYSLSEPAEMLSNTVGIWMAGELTAKNWQLSKVDLPGLTVGLPKGMKGYPAKNPNK